MPDELTDQTFAARLRAARRFRQMTQAELSEQSGVPVTSIAHLEGGGRKPSFDTFASLVLALQVDANFLVAQTDELQVSEQNPVIARVRLLGRNEINAVSAFLDALERGGESGP